MTSNYPWWLAWPVAEVAAAILPLFAIERCSPAGGVPRAIVNWCQTGNYKPPRGFSSTDATLAFDDPNCGAIAEAIQVLEHAGLLMENGAIEHTYVGLTRLGTYALETKTVRQHLGLGDAPPTA
jgi:hypothetical protein